MKILIACEFSGRVREAFRAKGENAWSCDLLPSEIPSKYHIQDNILNHLDDGWDMLIAFPPCTYLSNAGIAWFNEKKYGDNAIIRKQLRIEALNFVLELANAPISKICIENPVGWLNSHYRKPEQVIQPWQFGNTENKRTCLWLKNLPLLNYTNIVMPEIKGYFKSGKKVGKPIYFVDNIHGKHRAYERSRTFPGIAEAMALQWGFSSEEVG